MSGLIEDAERVVVATAAPYAGWLKLAAGVAAAAAFAYSVHWVDANYYGLKIADMRMQQQQAIIIAQDEARHQQEEADKITASLNAAALEARNHQLERMIANLGKVPQYVTPQTDARFPLPCGFARMHNADALAIDPAAVPLPAGKTDGERCEVAASAAIGIIGRNYATALGWKAELDTWRSWYDQQKAKWDEYRASAQKEK